MGTTSRAVFSEVIDYAGLFPPARLPMADAFSRYLRHLAGDAGWMMARFVCPASRLGELAGVMAGMDLPTSVIRVAVIGTGGTEPPSFAAAFERDTVVMKGFADKRGATATIDVFEVKLPGEGDPAETVDYVCDELTDVGAISPTPFFEVSLLGSDIHRRIARAAGAVSAAGHEIDPARGAGLKIRCGGLYASAVPSVEVVATAIIACRDTRIPLKATQGLHHPVRRFDPTLGTATHGFLNLLSASLLATAHGLDRATIETIVGEKDAQAFALTEHELRWRDLRTDTDAIVSGRRSAMTSFGSCSFSEPRDDLRTLGLL